MDHRGLNMQQFEIAFSGQIHPGAELEQVKADIARLFQADAALLERLFSGQRVVLKKGLDAAGVAKYHAAFQHVGAVLQVRDLYAEPEEEIIPGLPAEESSQSTPTLPYAAGYALLQVTPRDEYMAAFRNVQAPDFGIAPLGDDLQTTPEEVAAPDMDLSAFSLAPVGSEMGQLARPAPVALPDTSHLKLLDK
jgi:hypothetical protein